MSAFSMWLLMNAIILLTGGMTPATEPGSAATPVGTTYLSVLLGRLGNFPNELINLLFGMPIVLALFLVGYFVGRKGVREVLADKRFLRRVFVICLLVAAPITLWSLGVIPIFEGAGGSTGSSTSSPARSWVLPTSPG